MKKEAGCLLRQAACFFIFSKENQRSGGNCCRLTVDKIDRIPYNNGLHYCYLETYEKMSSKERNEFMLKPFPKKEKAVICINTGQVFKSMAEAAKALDVAQGKISLVCNGKRKQTKGYYFEFYEE